MPIDLRMKPDPKPEQLPYSERAKTAFLLLAVPVVVYLFVANILLRLP